MCPPLTKSQPVINFQSHCILILSFYSKQTIIGAKLWNTFLKNTHNPMFYIKQSGSIKFVFFYKVLTFNKHTKNWRVSGQADLLNRLTAINRSSSSSSFPLYTTFGAFSPCSDTIFSTENPFVAARSWSNLNSLKDGSFNLPLSPPSFSETFRRTVDMHTLKDVKRIKKAMVYVFVTLIRWMGVAGFESRPTAKREIETTRCHCWRKEVGFVQVL